MALAGVGEPWVACADLLLEDKKKQWLQVIYRRDAHHLNQLPFTLALNFTFTFIIKLTLHLTLTLIFNLTFTLTRWGSTLEG